MTVRLDHLLISDTDSTVLDLTKVEGRNDNVQSFDGRWDETAITARKKPRRVILDIGQHKKCNRHFMQKTREKHSSSRDRLSAKATSVVAFLPKGKEKLQERRTLCSMDFKRSVLTWPRCSSMHVLRKRTTGDGKSTLPKFGWFNERYYWKRNVLWTGHLIELKQGNCDKDPSDCIYHNRATADTEKTGDNRKTQAHQSKKKARRTASTVAKPMIPHENAEATLCFVRRAFFCKDLVAMKRGAHQKQMQLASSRHNVKRKHPHRRKHCHNQQKMKKPVT